MRRSALTRAALTGLAPLSMIGAHIAAYRAAAPGHHAHDELFAATGHGTGWWVAALLVTIVVGAVLQRAGRRGRHGHRRLGLFIGTALTLALVQTVAFASLEAFERVSAGLTATSLWQEPVMILGLAFQIVVAVLSALLVVLVVEVVTRLWSRTTRPRRETPLLVRPLSADPLRISVARVPASPRGPPLHL